MTSTPGRSKQLLALPFAFLLLACADDGKGAAEQAGSTTGDEDPTTTGDGDGDGDPTTTGDGDGDGEPTTSGDGDGDGDPNCTPGELGCECNNGLCLGDFECDAGICVSGCLPGELGCECNNGLCLGDFECSGNTCIDPNCTPGELDCECSNGLCLGDYVCSGNICTEPSGDGDGDPTGDGDGDMTGDGDGEPNPCPLPNQLPCNGNCIDVMDDDNNCGACGNVCAKNSEDGGCSEGVCLPYWSACFNPVVDFDNCNEACAAEGKSCVHLGCGNHTYKAYSGLGECLIIGTNGDQKFTFTCDTQLMEFPNVEGGTCCCDTL